MYWTVSLRPVFPIVPGHEASGVVVNVGDEVGNVAPGDPVSLDPSFYCGECSYAWSDAATCARTGTAPGWHVGRLCRRARPLASQEPASSSHSVDLALAALIEPLSCAIHAFDLLPR